jgi:hypothetical protein
MALTGQHGVSCLRMTSEILFLVQNSPQSDATIIPNTP